MGGRGLRSRVSRRCRTNERENRCSCIKGGNRPGRSTLRAWMAIAFVVSVVAVSLLVLTRPPPVDVLPSAECAEAGTGAGVRVPVADVPQGPVAGYRGEQLANAAAIVNSGQAS